MWDMKHRATDAQVINEGESRSKGGSEITK